MRAVPSSRPRRLLLALGTTIVAALAAAGAASAATYTVNTTTDTTSCTSSSCSLRGAVIAADTAGGSSTIDVPAGLYKLTIPASSPDNPANGDLDITANVTIVGAGSDSTTLSGNNDDRLFSVQSGGALTLSKMTIRGGYPASASSGSQDGGAIYADGPLTVTGDVTFKDNTSPDGDYGGAIYADTGSTVSLTGATFENSSAYYGGAIYDDSGNLLSISKSTFASNTGKDDEGGAIEGVGNGGLNVSSTTFNGNNSYEGGAVYWDTNEPVTITHSTFTGNSASGYDGYGGAIVDYDSSSMTLDYDSFINNNASDDGGALYLDATSATNYTFNNDLFKGNSTQTDVGGAITWYNGTLSSSDSTYEDNSTYYGGAIYAGSGYSMTLINDTISHNTAYDEAGGGLYVDTTTPASLVNDTITDNVTYKGDGGGIDGTADLTKLGYVGSGTPGIENTVIADNNGGDCDTQFTSLFDNGHNMDSDGSCFSTSVQSSDKPNTEPNLGNPADNGGPLVGNTTDGSAVVIPTDAETASSPTVNAGTNSGCPATDERGVTRPQGGLCDIGAFELAAAKLSVKKSAPSSVTVHREFTYTIKVSDSGPAGSTSTKLVDKIPSSESLKHVIAPSGATCSHKGRTVTCELGDIRKGGSSTVKIEVVANKTGKVKNTATATNAQGSKASGHVTTTVKSATVKSAKKKRSPTFTG